MILQPICLVNWFGLYSDLKTDLLPAEKSGLIEAFWCDLQSIKCDIRFLQIKLGFSDLASYQAPILARIVELKLILKTISEIGLELLF